MLTHRLLPPDEWDRLEGTDLGAVRAHLDPHYTQIAVVEDDTGAIVGCWAALLILHAEGVWIREDHRGRGAVTLRLWRQMQQIARSVNKSHVMTGADSPAMAALLTRARARPVPYQEYSLCLFQPL